MQRGLRVITLQGAIEKSSIMLSQNWENELLDGTIILSYFGGSNDIVFYIHSSHYFPKFENHLNLMLYYSNPDYLSIYRLK